jgi:hypothetical protein
MELMFSAMPAGRTLIIETPPKQSRMNAGTGGTERAARYFNPCTDFGFKKLFGEEANACR